MLAAALESGPLPAGSDAHDFSNTQSDFQTVALSTGLDFASCLVPRSVSPAHQPSGRRPQVWHPRFRNGPRPRLPELNYLRSKCLTPHSGLVAKVMGSGAVPGTADRRMVDAWRVAAAFATTSEAGVRGHPLRL
ncbi:hypothetical protein TRVL_05631 [Trypanosoma vivax]|nr:hypothetical protein TRVL_05631 [Trypanosoma vivax]